MHVPQRGLICLYNGRSRKDDSKFTMGQTVAKQQEDLIPELKDVTLKGVVPLNDELGRGAYGSVFTVKQGDVVCAAKKIHPILIESVIDEEKQRIKDDFIRECLCCSSISHPHIVQFVGVYYSDQSSLPIMVMELMHVSLTKFVTNNKSNISFGRKISILHDASRGLSFLHNHKPQILHRDLSPNNIMLTSKLVAKVGDLGVAKVVRAGSKETISKLQLTRAVPGTPDFMPPEVMEVNAVYGAAIDVFSFGGIALYVFSEEWPTPSGQKMMDPVTEELVALSEAERRQKYLDKMIDKAAVLKDMVKRCLSDNPKKRPMIQEVSAFIIIEPYKVSVMSLLSYVYYSYVTIYIMGQLLCISSQ